MKKLFKITAVAAIVSLASCAPLEELIKQTTSGQPEGYFDNTTIEDAKGKLASACSRHGLLVVNTNNNEVVCQKTLTGKDAVLSGLLVGTRYGTTPTRKLRFVMYGQGNGVQVIAYDYLESQNAFGQTNQQPLNANHQRNDIQEMLFSIGAE